MMNLPGYEFQQLFYESKHSILYKAIRLSDRQPVIIKRLPNAKMNAAEIRRFQQEFAIGSKFNSAYTVKCLELYTDNQYQAIIFEDQGAVSLEQALPKEGYPLQEFLTLAMQMAQGLSDIHQQEITHKDIKLSNFIIDVKSHRIKYIDFGSATSLREENQSVLNPNKVTGTLAYISPEQTGRMNRTVDYRTDFYSLGVALYQLLCGQLPFIETEAMTLIHAHLAREPTPVHERKAGIPSVVSTIIQKLMRKNPEERYQSAQGLLSDLKRCLTELTENQQVSTFEIAQQDFAQRFQVSQKLYGRDREIALLINAFQRTSIGKPEVLVVSGYSGIGKSALINEIQKPIALKNGRFLMGKFDQLSKTTAYSAIIQAFQGLLKQLLSENEAILQHWRETLLSALGVNGQLIIEMLPEIELIIGKQPEVLMTGPTEAKNRFNLTFQRFINVFTKKEQPLVLFLDDLQWADTASLELIKLMMINPDIQHLLLIGAYRDNEVDDLHPAVLIFEEIKKAQVDVYLMTLTSLDSITVQQWLADSLKDTIERVKPLVELVYQKTQGNPFFIKMFLRALDDEKLLIRSDNYQWQWDIESIQHQQAMANVVEFMIRQIHKLDSATQRLLALASCLGHRFTLDLLAITSQTNREAIFADLQRIFNVGLAYQKEDNIYFTHDRVQEAAYSLLSGDEKKATHLSIGRLLLQTYSLEMQPEKVFDIVDHLNIGLELITNTDERFELATLNRLASQKAKKATAYTAALNYIHAAFAYLDEASIWSKHYDLAFSMYKEKAELEYLNSNFEASERIVYHILDYAQSILEKADVYNLLMVQKTILAQNEEAIQLGKTALQLFNIDLSLDKYDEMLSYEQQKMKELLANKTIDSLIDMPQMVILEKIAIFELLNTLLVPTFVAYRDLYALVIVLVVNLVLGHGQLPEAALSYVFYASVLCQDCLTAKQGYEFGLLAIRLCEKYNNSALTCKVHHVFSILINHWFKSLKSGYAMSNNSFHVGLTSGEIQYAGYSRFNAAVNLFFRGELLLDVVHEVNKLAEFCMRTKNQFAVDTIICVQHAVRALLGEQTPDLESGYIMDIKKRRNFYALGFDFFFKAQFSYLHGRYEEALYYIRTVEKSFPYLQAHYILAEHNFYHSLILAGLYNHVTLQEQQCYQEQLATNQQMIAAWAENCPENFRHKNQLISAEIARLNKNDWQANELYEEAIKGAQQNGFLQDEALANELAGRFWLAKNREPFAKLHFTQAFLLYQRWGAKSKLNFLKKNYLQQLNQEALSTAKSPSYSALTTTNTSSILLDMENIIKVSQVISSDINLEKLLFNMMKIIIETAGAQTGVLFLNNQGILSAKVEYTLSSQIKILQTPSLSSWMGAYSIIEYVKNTGQTVLLGKATEDKQFGLDPYISTNTVKSVLCIAIKKQEALKGLLYVENNLAHYAFTQNCVTVLTILTSQMAISLENAVLFEAVKKEITERTHINASLQISEKRYRTLAQATHAVIWSVNGEGNAVERQPSWEAFTGQTWEQYRGAGWLNAIHLEDRERIWKEWSQAIKAKSIYHNLNRMWYYQGYYKYVHVHAAPLIDERGEVTEWIGTCLDVHELKETEAALKSNSEQLQLALDAGKAGLWRWDFTTHSLIYDDRFKALYGLAETLSLNSLEEIAAFIHSDDKARFLQELQDLLSNSSEDKYESEYRIIWLDKNIHYVASRGQLFRSAMGEPQRLVGISLDITTRKQLENERIQALQLAEEQERRRAEEAEAHRRKQEEFVDTICHEIRNPLNGIYGGLSLLDDKLKDVESIFKAESGKLETHNTGKLYDDFRYIKDTLDSLEKCAQQQKVIVDDVLDLSRLESNKMELNKVPFLLNKMLTTTIKLFKPQSEQKKLTINIMLPEAESWIKTDEHRITQIINNLLSNAIKFTHAGSITFTASVIALADDKTALHITIQDTGIGMTTDEVLRLFGRFAQANRRTQAEFGGSGLGLAITKKLVEALGGTIEVESKKWHGTSFRFTIICEPLTAAEKLQLGRSNIKKRNYEQVTSSIPQLPQATNKTILIVEDNLMNQKILINYLEQRGYLTRVANNGIEALEQFQQFEYNLIFMDIEMPVMGGIKATQEIRAYEQTLNRQQTPIIGLSGNARKEHREEALRIGMNAYLTKPYCKEDIYKTLEGYIKIEHSSKMLCQSSSEIKIESAPHLSPSTCDKS